MQNHLFRMFRLQCQTQFGEMPFTSKAMELGEVHVVMLDPQEGDEVHLMCELADGSVYAEVGHIAKDKLDSFIRNMLACDNLPMYVNLEQEYPEYRLFTSVIGGALGIGLIPCVPQNAASC